MNKYEIYQSWAPSSSIWSDWVKPVLFAHMMRSDDLPAGADSPDVDLSFVAPADGSTALIIDMPGDQSTLFGLTLAQSGYRPIPLYNSLPNQSLPVTAMVRVEPIIRAMERGSPILTRLNIPSDAPPAFLLDSNRRIGTGGRDADWDNRSISLPTDFPSANFLLAQRITSVLVITGALVIEADLTHTLRRWQEAGLKILTKTYGDPGPVAPVQIPRPPRFRSLFYNFLATLGLRRNPLGGFGGYLLSDSAGG